ncbi:protein DEHYDRATION-INDUCED 19 homolog 4-like isoform X2 [Durio zibethinus]|uniref:Protein DEHYDRATION-INDUCED 19 homolog 4-like isoform X2 n=1 Tax=Durio zibethinus TaxID=66656 RepID=A0A6P5YMR0_DURZI|nr:protein DEHYDRATION-INDUCED 19 homolog 4-like isoform X2 [Durio zibethinus]
MESNPWSFRFSNSSSSSSSRRHQTRSDLFLGGGYEEVDGDVDFKAEFLCPFCAEDFDIVGLCCHIDEEHPVEAKNGVSLTESYVQRKRRLRKGGSNLTFSMLRKELREGNLQALLGGSSCIVSSSNVEPDPLLSSFMFNPPTADEPLSLQPLCIAEANAIQESTNKEFLERKPQQSQLSDKEHEEKARRCGFVQGLLMSTILGDNL